MVYHLPYRPAILSVLINQYPRQQKQSIENRTIMMLGEDKQQINVFSIQSLITKKLLLDSGIDYNLNNPVFFFD